MEHFVVSARKYRPQTFKDVVGQQAITNTLANAIAHNHLAQALLFTGPRGVGKTTCARILAKMINQDGTQSPDEDFAFNIFELDAASNNSVDDIRNLIDQVRIPPQVGTYKVYIIDEVHMLSTSAFNAFLKTLEEPPKHAIFILATTEKHKIIPTILSRCQIFDFKRITVTDAKEYLKYIAEQEGVVAEEDALQIIAQKADGAMRDALSIYDRVVSFSGNNLTRQAVTENLNVLDYDTYMQVTDLLLDNNIPQLLVLFNDILSNGFDGHHFIAGLASHFRDLLVCKDQRTIQLLEVGEQTKAKYFEQSQKTSQQFLLQAIDLANECDLKYKSSRNQRLLVELCLMQIASVTFDGEKKNSSPKIVPASHFEQPAKSISQEEKSIIRNNEYGQNETAPKEAQQPSVENRTENDSCAPEATPANQQYFSKEVPNTSEEKTDDVAQSNEVKPQQKTAPNPNHTPSTEVKQERVSGLSLASIRKKKELEAQVKDKAPERETVMTEKFTETQLQAAWDDYVHKLKKRGEKILASILETDLPTLKNDNEIHLELPAESMKIDLERGQHKLMGFLKTRLKNTTINLVIDVNESTAKKFVFTPIEKYNKLKEKNPLLDKLRTTFDLDV
ncbi:DNA polymerase III subunit gamma/tau [Zunongwangia atlantica]|uniref:DNA polymerase III subunit gamma/tau n=1 Tax=Zunongwangia atlantica 22II14-10F7 TaxID=1185767 RepID=A0A1Y1SZY2_9FLAO|nr:DNA polymerase III subunit gamma/tau [Zunongwangia atlantica]ORL44311.1 DNA polymerase III subunit gamma/tau [Zunongwangia atlantica 22II14-10F7]